MAEPQSLKTHLITELKDLLDAERQLTRVLPGFARQATIPALRTVFEQHLRETETQIDRLEKAFEILGEAPEAKRCEGMHGLIREGSSVVGATPAGALRDAVMITAAQKVEHYEIASYGTARTYARVLGEPRVARLLQDTLEEEKKADAKLTEVAEGNVNDKAAAEWHQVAGLIEQTAALAGTAVGIGARTIKRAASAVGLGQQPGGGGPSTTAVAQIQSSMNQAIDAAGETATAIARQVASRARRATQPSRNVSRQRATPRKPSAKAAKQGAKKKRARRSRSG
jgi:ferritin-like metal-binding protein YciE